MLELNFELNFLANTAADCILESTSMNTRAQLSNHLHYFLMSYNYCSTRATIGISGTM